MFILAQKQSERQLCRLEPPSRIETRTDDKTDVVSTQRRNIQVVFLHQLAKSHTLRLRCPPQPFFHHDPVFILQLHHIAHRGNGCKFNHRQPFFPVNASFFIKDLDQLISHHTAADLFPRIGIRRLLRIDDGICLRQYIFFSHFGNIVMIRHDHRHAQFPGALHLIDGRNSIITGQDCIYVILSSCLHNLDIDPISVLDPVRNLIIHCRSQSF